MVQLQHSSSFSSTQFSSVHSSKRITKLNSRLFSNQLIYYVIYCIAIANTNNKSTQVISSQLDLLIAPIVNLITKNTKYQCMKAIWSNNLWYTKNITKTKWFSISSFAVVHSVYMWFHSIKKVNHHHHHQQQQQQQQCQCNSFISFEMY